MLSLPSFEHAHEVSILISMLIKSPAWMQNRFSCLPGHVGPNISTPISLLKRNKNLCTFKDLYTNAHSSFICNSHKPEATQLDKLWNIHAMEYCSSIKWNKLLIQHHWIFKKLCWVKECRHKRMHTVWFHFYVVLKQEKPICSEENQGNCCLRPR